MKIKNEETMRLITLRRTEAVVMERRIAQLRLTAHNNRVEDWWIFTGNRQGWVRYLSAVPTILLASAAIRHHPANQPANTC